MIRERFGTGKHTYANTIRHKERLYNICVLWIELIVLKVRVTLNSFCMLLAIEFILSTLKCEYWQQIRLSKYNT